MNVALEQQKKTVVWQTVVFVAIFFRKICCLLLCLDTLKHCWRLTFTKSGYMCMHIRAHETYIMLLWCFQMVLNKCLLLGILVGYFFVSHSVAGSWACWFLACLFARLFICLLTHSFVVVVVVALVSFFEFIGLFALVCNCNAVCRCVLVYSVSVGLVWTYISPMLTRTAMNTHIVHFPCVVIAVR